MDTGRPASRREIAPREPGAVRAALRYVRATPDLWIPLALMAIVGTLGFNFQAVLPLLAKFTFEGGAGAYAALVSAMGIGAIVGALATGARGQATPGLLAGAAIGFGALALLAAGAPTMALEVVVLAPLGAASVTFAASVNSALQLASDPVMRGRVMALYSVVFLGSTPIGGPLAGWLSRGARPARGPGHGRRRRNRGGPARPRRLRPRRARGHGRRRRGGHDPPRLAGLTAPNEDRPPKRRPVQRPRQDGQGYVSGALLGGYVWPQTTGGAFRQNARDL